jgi:phosphatidylserine decarboxylase
MTNSDIILKQGYKPIIISLVIAIILEIFISSFLSNIVLFCTLAIAFVYRNPNRHIFANKRNILSPVDGKVMAIDNIHGKQKIYCKVNPCNTHIVRAPSSGTFKIKKYQYGLNLNPNSYKANMLNEQIIVKFDNLKLKFISGICNPTIEFINKKYANQGDSLGLFIDGIVIITIKNKNNLLINIGDKLTAGQTTIFKQ